MNREERLKKDVILLFWMILSAMVYSIAITSFSDLGGLYPGGFAGISRIIQDIGRRFFNLEIPFGILYLLMNLGPTLLVFKYIGKRFTIFSVIQYALVSFFTLFFKPILDVHDPLLIAVFGGLLGGVGIGIALRNNASSGGTDFIAIYISNRFNISTWNYVMIANTIVLCVAGLLFGWEKALYSIIYQFVSTQVIQKLHKRYKMETLTIITKNPQQVIDNVLKGTRHGITEIHAEGAFSHSDMTMLYTVINAFQRGEVIRAVLEVDHHAFINIQETKDIIGNYYQKPLD